VQDASQNREEARQKMIACPTFSIYMDAARPATRMSADEELVTYLAQPDVSLADAAALP
jgi:hypothetical protein